MVSTVTTTTVSSVATLAAFGVVAVLLLVVLVVTKELVATGSHQRLVALNRLLNVAIYPLFLAFGVILAQRTISLL